MVWGLGFRVSDNLLVYFVFVVAATLSEDYDYSPSFCLCVCVCVWQAGGEVGVGGWVGG
jgi:hypothetical protein